MPAFLYVCIIITLCLWAISVPISITVTLDYDVLKNEGTFLLFFFGISLIKIKVTFIKFDANEKSVKLMLGKKEFTAKLSPPDKKDSVFNYITMPLFAIIDFVYFDIRFFFGYKKDALMTALVVQLARMASDILTSMLKSNQEIEIDDIFQPVYDNDRLKLSFYGIISASIANIIYSYLHAVILRFRKKDNKRAGKLKGEAV